VLLIYKNQLVRSDPINLFACTILCASVAINASNDIKKLIANWINFNTVTTLAKTQRNFKLKKIQYNTFTRNAFIITGENVITPSHIFLFPRITNWQAFINYNKISVRINSSTFNTLPVTQQFKSDRSNVK